MRAVAIERYGGHEEMDVVERPEPEPGAGEVVVRVEAAGVGLWDAKVRRDVGEAVGSRLPEGVDASLECVGGENFDRSLRAVRPGGRAVGLVDEPPGGAPDGVRVSTTVGRPSASRLAELVGLVDAGHLRIEVKETFRLAAAARAHALVEAGHARGKVVLTVP